MKHFFLPYPLALIAKEKGFDEGCLAFFYYGQRLEIGFNWLDEGCKNSLLEETIAAPLYQQITDWLREKHGIHVAASSFPVYNGQYGYNYSRTNATGGFVPEGTTYYEALNKAIEEAFKLIS